MQVNVKLPNFNHPEVNVFYAYDLSIPKEEVVQVIALPRKTLIEDMELMIKDCIDRNDLVQISNKKEP